MVRAFLKHSEEAAEDDELAEVHRELYDYMLAIGGPLKEGKAEEYFKLARKKFAKLRRATELFMRIQPEVSQHTNFIMAAVSLAAAVKEVGRLLECMRGGEGERGREGERETERQRDGEMARKGNENAQP
jgi:hypothetical protein